MSGFQNYPKFNLAPSQHVAHGYHTVPIKVDLTPQLSVQPMVQPSHNRNNVPNGIQGGGLQLKYRF